MTSVLKALGDCFGSDLKTDFPLRNLTTMKIGGPARYFVSVGNKNSLIKAIDLAKKFKLKWYFISSDGSNLVPSDHGFGGLVIKNEIKSFKVKNGRVVIGSGNDLLKSISKLNKLGLAGMEKMAGIPGTVGGAIYGCAGAYGQDIKNCLIGVEIYDGTKSRWLSKPQCRFGYRESIFKKRKNLIIIGAEFDFKKDNPRKLLNISRRIIKLREEKYRPGLLCPGSFFKNIVVKDIKPRKLREKFLSKIDKSKIIHGKIPAGYLLEMVGAKNVISGGISVAKHHGNLIFNTGDGKAEDIEKIAKILKTRTKRRFGLELEEEIQYL